MVGTNCLPNGDKGDKALKLRPDVAGAGILCNVRAGLRGSGNIVPRAPSSLAD
jgi:hypothetical protein